MDPRPDPPVDSDVSGSRNGAGDPDSDSGSFNVFPRPMEARELSGKSVPPPPSVALARLPVVPREVYTVAGDVAAGGVGRILRARDERLGRPVALKELRFDPTGVDGERFVREVMITAKLQHPSIVTIHEAGRWPSGEPFYAMELVAGRSLADVLAETTALADRLALLPHVLAATEAMAYAHSRGIVHRDLKPGNVLVGSFGETVVIDWGLAKDLSGKGAVPEPGPIAPSQWEDPETLTMAGAILGTPTYMPPEQARGYPVDERADVYALGAILHHLVAGAPPYTGKTPMRVIRRVLEGPPPRLEGLQRDAPAELCSIVRRAMARDAAQRYPDARSLADDLRRFGSGQKVAAHRYSRLDRIHRFVSRYRATVVVGASAFVLLAITGGLGFVRVLAARDDARGKQAEAEAAQGEALRRADDLTLVEARAAAAHDPTRAVAWLRSLSPRFDRWSAARVIAEDARAKGIATVISGHEGAVNDLAFSLDGRLLATGSDDRTVRVQDLATGKSTVIQGHTDEVWVLLFLADGKTLASAGKDRTIHLTSLDTFQSRVLTGHEGPVTRLAGSPDGRLMVSSSFDRTLRLWDTSSSQSWILRGSGDEVRAVALSSDRRWVASGRMDGTVQIRDLERGQERTLGQLEAGVLEVAFSPDDGTLVVALWNGAVHAWSTDAATRAPAPAAPMVDRVLSGPIRGYEPTSYHALAFSRDGRHLVFAREEGLTVLDTEAGTARTLSAPDARLTSVAISPDQRLVAAGSSDAVHVWDLATGGERTLHGFVGPGTLCAFSPDGRYLASAGTSDRAVRLYPVREERPAFTAHAGGVTSAQISPDGRLLATAGRDGTARLWELARPASSHPGASGVAPDVPPVELTGHRGITEVALAPDGLTVATAGEEGTVRIWDVSGRLLHVFEARPGREPLLRFSPDSRLVAFAGAGSTVCAGDVDTGAARIFTGHTGAVDALAFSPRSDLLASAGQDGVVRVWDLRAGGDRIFRGHTEHVSTLSFSPDGATLVSGGADHTLRFWPVAGGQDRSVAVGGGGVLRVLFSRDGKTVLYTSQLESTVRQMDAATGRDLGALAAREGDLTSIALSPDETRVAATTVQGAVRLWDRRTGESRTVAGHAGPARDVAFSPDGTVVVSAGDDGAVRFWEDDLPEDPAALRAWLAQAGGEGAGARSAQASASPLP